jgi:hypothetical protein
MILNVDIFCTGMKLGCVPMQLRLGCLHR